MPGRLSSEKWALLRKRMLSSPCEPPSLQSLLHMALLRSDRLTLQVRLHGGRIRVRTYLHRFCSGDGLVYKLRQFWPAALSRVARRSLLSASLGPWVDEVPVP